MFVFILGNHFVTEDWLCQECKDTHVRFTQYVRPNGHKRTVYAPVSPAAVEMVKQMQDQFDMRFECEVLTTGQVSFTAEMDDVFQDTRTIAHELVPNDATIPASVERLIGRAYVMCLGPKS
jgi:hypothetical protein